MEVNLPTSFMGGHRYRGVRAWSELKRPEHLRFFVCVYFARLPKSIICISHTNGGQPMQHPGLRIELA